MGVGKMLVQDESGQMTVEFVVVFPVLIIVAVIMVNLMLFFSECAAFDRISRDAVRIHGTSMAYGQSIDNARVQIEQTIERQLVQDHLSSQVTYKRNILGHVTYTAELEFYPTLFGMNLRSSFFGISLPPLRHTVTMTVDTYKPGILI